ncbi:hypothetical protein C1Y40_02185 [Mycobacterium talmoniae]|uniref:Uncharacterized protein n=1 Tax=Mycobacterium talmoniae TaxID=1858794 RepID=A0A2S8BLP1_9MYCO|nr:hypothetical protein C1Y40_02185 [Mycobacterium talmoniae]
MRPSALAGSTQAIGSRPMLSTRVGRVPNVSRTTSSPSRMMTWSAIDPLGINRTPLTGCCCGSNATNCRPVLMSSSTAPNRASNRAAQT